MPRSLKLSRVPPLWTAALWSESLSALEKCKTNRDRSLDRFWRADYDLDNWISYSGNLFQIENAPAIAAWPVSASSICNAFCQAFG